MGIIPDKYLADLTRALKNIGKKTGKTGEGQTDGKAAGKEGRKMSGWMALSPMLVFLVLNKKIMEGVTMGAVKG